MAEFKINISATGEATIDRLDKKVKQLDGTATKAQGSSDKLGSAIKGIATAAAAYITVNALVSSVKALATSAVNTTAKFEQFNAVLTTIEGSAYKAEESMKWITDFAKTTPYELDNVTESFVKLRSYGIDPTNDILKTLGDTASAMGKPIIDAVEAMAGAMVGEGERLKQFGIRASVMGDEIKYSWTNSSGEARQAIVANNSAIIESTLGAIFNSKYAGAMEMQSKTWNGLVSNMKDSWTIFQGTIMQEGGVFDYLKAIVTVVGEYMTNAFSTAQGGAKEFGLGVIDSIKGAITSAGFLYDAFSSIGLIFKIIGKTGEFAFATLMSTGINLASTLTNVFEDLIDGLGSAFAFVVNTFASGINIILDVMRSIGMYGGGNIGELRFEPVNIGGDLLAEYADASITLIANTGKELGDLIMQIGDIGTGQTFTDRIIGDIDSAYDRIKNQVLGGADKEDFGGVPADLLETPIVQDEEALKDFKADIENAIAAVEDMQQPINDTVTAITGDGGLNDSFTIIQDSFNDVINTNDDLIDSYKQVVKETKKFIFQWENTFLNSISSNMNSLQKVFGSKDGAASVSYQDALISALNAQTQLIANPLDATAGSTFESSYAQLVDSAMSYLQPSSFGTSSEMAFASARVGLELEDMRDTAVKAYDVQEAMLEVLTVMNQAFADGILTDAEREDIKSVADKVNAKNQDLLRDNTILGKDGTINSLYKGENINAQVNTISGYATNAALTGTNSVSSFIGALKTSIESGISIDSLLNMTAIASVASGLKTDQISNVKTAVDGNTAAVTGTNLKGTSVKTLDGLRVKSVSTIQHNLYSYFYNGAWMTGGSVPSTGTNATIIGQTGTHTAYTYFANGGYTGDGNKYDEAGIVHRGEYVVNKATTADLGLNNNTGGVFRVMAKSLQRIESENKDLKNLMVRLVADNSKMLTIDRAAYAQMVG